MYNHTRKSTLTLLGALVFALSFLATAKAFAVSPYLIQAQEAYLNKENNRAMESIGRALRETKLSSPEFKNLLALYGRIARDSNQQVDLGWKLPDSVSALRVNVMFLDLNSERSYRLSLSGDLKTGVTIKSFKLRRYPDYQIIDTDKNLGGFEQGSGQHGYYFYTRSKAQSIPIASGVYLLDFETSLGEVAKGWFTIADDLNSSETPDFTGLKWGQEFQQLDPIFSWNSFASPQYQKGEKKVVRFSIHPMDGPSSWTEPVWLTVDPTALKTSVDLSTATPTHAPLAAIKDGDYMAFVSYQDSRVNLPLRIVRDSKVGRKIVFKTK